MAVKKILSKFFTILPVVALSLLIFVSFGHLASAHEVYVLDQATIDEALKQPPLEVFSIIYSESARFFFWTFLTILILFFVGFVSISKNLEKWLDPTLLSLRKYAPLIGRITLGLSVIYSAYFAALFGPELPMTLFLPEIYILPFRIFLAIAGLSILFGLATRLFSTLMILIYFGMVLKFSFYMLTYLNYFGEMVIALAWGSKMYSLDSFFKSYLPAIFNSTVILAEEYAFLILRLGFGVSLIFAALYAKLIHAQLAIYTVVQYHLTDYFHFSPSFIVLGALAVELLLGTLFILGIEVRFAAMFLIVFLSMSLVYFGEAVWPHIILAGGAFTIFAYGYGRFTLERRYLDSHHRKGEEPVF